MTEVKIGVFITEEGSKVVAKEAPEIATEVLGHFCCFVAGTPVSTQFGLRPIEQIKVGDLVLSKDPVTGLTAYKPVIAVVPRHDRDIFEVKLDVKLPDGSSRLERIQTTADHPWRTSDGRWTETDKLTIGEFVLTAYGASVSVKAVRDTKRTAPTYNLEIADFHTYFVGDSRIWVHNSCLNFGDFNQARNAAVKWLDERGFKAEVPNISKLTGKPYGMMTADGKIGFRVEFDAANGAHINV